MAKDAPLSTLFAFSLADGLLFIGAALLCIYGFRKEKEWAWGVLCIHFGASAYATLYCWTLTLLTAGEGLIGGLLMLTSASLLGRLVYRLRPVGDKR
jgi:hypothetical protein